MTKELELQGEEASMSRDLKDMRSRAPCPEREFVSSAHKNSLSIALFSILLTPSSTVPWESCYDSHSCDPRYGVFLSNQTKVGSR